MRAWTWPSTQMLAKSFCVMAIVVALSSSQPARGEVAEVRLAQQYGTNYLPLMAMDQLKLVEKHLAAKGLTATKVSWTQLTGPSAIIDAFLSNAIDFSAQGIPSTILGWERTRSGIGIKAVAALCDSDIKLNVRDPNIKSVRDLTDKDRLALPSIKTSAQALFLQFAAEKEFGPGQWGKLDRLAVSMAHPDAVAALLNPNSEITGHLATSPFSQLEIKRGAHPITTLYEAAGGQASGLNFVSTEKFRRENPKVYDAVVAAYEEGLAWVNADKRRAAKLYVAIANEKKLSESEIFEILSEPGYVFGKTPHKIFKSMDLMFRNGTLKVKPVSWKDLYFAEVHDLEGD